jgi:hypothetical protein
MATVKAPAAEKAQLRENRIHKQGLGAGHANRTRSHSALVGKVGGAVVWAHAWNAVMARP